MINRYLHGVSRPSFLLSCLLVGMAAWATPPRAEAKPKHLLIVSVTKGFRHSSIPTAERVLEEMSRKSGVFTADFVRDTKDDSDDRELARMTTPENLKKYDGVIFVNTTGDLPLADREGFLKWIQSGKAFIGMHSCSDTFHGFPPFIEMLGGEFLTHGPQVTVDGINQDPAHPACKHLGPVYRLHDEIYLFKNFHRERVHGLLTMDKHPNKGFPGDFAIAWCKEHGKGKVFYTSLGHREDVWESETYQKHVLGGIEWALGLKKGDGKPQKLSAKLPSKEAREGFRPLFNGTDLAGWKLRNPSGTASWSAQNGMLVNTIPDGGHGTDLVSTETFGDFVVRYEFMVPKGSNSGFYLRGRHEIQILDDYDTKEPKSGGNGAIYNLKPVSTFASRKIGEWQQAEATIRGNRVTVRLNGILVHDNVTVDRPTGGELDANVAAPGPIMLQGDHGAIAFRNVRIKSLK